MQYSHVVVSFNSLQEVNEYEKYFNQEIFIPAWNDMLFKVRSLELIALNIDILQTLIDKVSEAKD